MQNMRMYVYKLKNKYLRYFKFIWDEIKIYEAIKPIKTNMKKYKK